MKYVLSIVCVSMIVCFGISSVDALSFAQGTVFIDAQTQESCEAAGGSFTEWYGETYCTLWHDDMILTEQEQNKINQVGDIVSGYIGSDSSAHDQVRAILEQYKERFIESAEWKKLAIAQSLMVYLSSHR